jgi:Protein of unknown function (DUF3501)
MGEVRRLRLEDIADLRAYERDRPELQRQVFESKRLRRVALGSIMSVVFENELSVRYQIQEMARVEKLTTDAQILDELKAYNPLIPDPGELSATLFLELTDEAALREWLPKLVGIERALRIGVEGAEAGGAARTGKPSARRWIRSAPEVAHEGLLTREDVTASVHYVRFVLSPEEVESFASGSVLLASDHPAYEVEVELSEETRQELLSDLRA